jgi:hypothetical protein
VPDVTPDGSSNPIGNHDQWLLIAGKPLNVINDEWPIRIPLVEASPSQKSDERGSESYKTRFGGMRRKILAPHSVSERPFDRGRKGLLRTWLPEPVE